MLLSELNWLLFGRSYQRNVHNLCLTKVYFQQLLKPGMKFTYTYIQFWKYPVSNVVFSLALGMLKSTLAISTSAACASADSEIRLRQSWPKQTLTERVCVCTCHIYIYIYILLYTDRLSNADTTFIHLEEVFQQYYTVF